MFLLQSLCYSRQFLFSVVFRLFFAHSRIRSLCVFSLTGEKCWVVQCETACSEKRFFVEVFLLFAGLLFYERKSTIERNKPELPPAGRTKENKVTKKN